MSKILALLILLFPSLLLGQATIRVTPKRTNECYYVLKSDTSIRQGSYTKWGWNDKSKVEGFYKNGIRDSIWAFYDTKGTLEQKYDFTNKILLYTNIKNTGTPIKGKIIKGTDTIEVILDQYPAYIGGTTELSRFFRDNLQGLAPGSLCIIYIVLAVDTNGHATYIEILGHPPVAPKEILRLTKLLPYDWIPATYKGEKVNAYFIFPTYFYLN